MKKTLLFFGLILNTAIILSSSQPVEKFFSKGLRKIEKGDRHYIPSDYTQGSNSNKTLQNAQENNLELNPSIAIMLLLSKPINPLKKTFHNSENYKHPRLIEKGDRHYIPSDYTQGTK